jgi:predicted outer membrane repeat protein
MRARHLQYHENSRHNDGVMVFGAKAGGGIRSEGCCVIKLGVGLAAGIPGLLGRLKRLCR